MANFQTQNDLPYFQLEMPILDPNYARTQFSIQTLLSSLCDWRNAQRSTTEWRNFIYWKMEDCLIREQPTTIGGVSQVQHTAE